MLRSATALFLTAALLAVMLLASACTDSTTPAGTADGNGRVGAQGTFDPDAETFVLKTLEMLPPWDGPPIQIQLVGSNLTVDEANQYVSLDIAIRNISDRVLFAPAVVWVENFTPSDVSIINPDLTLAPPSFAATDTSFADWIRYGFDYSDFLGGDGALEVQEMSGTKTWIFHDPGLLSFSFQGWAEFGTAPDQPRIAGLCFSDLNHNGIPDPDEPPLPGAYVLAVTPTGEILRAQTDEMGHYALHVQSIGLYSLEAGVVFDMPPFLGWTTPNPREVLLTPGPDGVPNSFLDAHFGRAGYNPPPPATIGFTDRSPGALHHAGWTFIDAEIEGDRLHLRVGFSGCGPDHPFSLWMSGEFMESMPVQANLVLVNELDEECDAWFERDLYFSLQPLGDRFMRNYGPGELILNFVQPDSTVNELLWGIFPPD